MTDAAWGSLAIPPVAAVVGLAGLSLGMGGMIAGVFIVVLLPIGLVAAFPPLILGVIGKYGRATWLRIVFGVVALVSLSIMVPAITKGLVPLASNPPRILPKTSDGKRATRLEFRFPKVTRVVHDPHGRLRFYHGEAPEVISLPDGSGLLVFHGDWTGLSTWVDRVAVGDERFDIGGWMGATRLDEEIRVSKEGSFEHVSSE
jgi:hypothetical protein